jgi:hypothetical protein
VVPQAPFIDLPAANAVAAVWCTEVNALKQIVELMRSHKTAAEPRDEFSWPDPHSREQTSTFNGGGWNLHRSVQPAIWGWRRDLCFAHAAILPSHAHRQIRSSASPKRGAMTQLFQPCCLRQPQPAVTSQQPVSWKTVWH